MPLEYLMFWTRETFANVRRNALMSLLAVTSVTVALFILGAFYLVLSNGRALVQGTAQNLDLAIILDRDVSPSRRKQIYEAARIPQVLSVQFVSKDAALREMGKSANVPVEDFKGDQNPLGDELRLKLKNPEDAFKVRDYMASIKGVSQVVFDGDIARDVLGFNRLLAISGAVALCVLGLGALLIVHNTIRLTIFARRREVRIMELVGATPGFIRTPFVLEGMIYGVAGAVLAAGLLSALYSALDARKEPLVQTLVPLSAAQLLPACWAGVLVAGIAFGVVGAWLSLARTIGKAV